MMPVRSPIRLTFCPIRFSSVRPACELRVNAIAKPSLSLFITQHDADMADRFRIMPIRPPEAKRHRFMVGPEST
jgi:hypothetical protein